MKNCSRKNQVFVSVGFTVSMYGPVRGTKMMEIQNVMYIFIVDIEHTLARTHKQIISIILNVALHVKETKKCRKLNTKK